MKKSSSKGLPISKPLFESASVSTSDISTMEDSQKDTHSYPNQESEESINAEEICPEKTTNKPNQYTIKDSKLDMSEDNQNQNDSYKEEPNTRPILKLNLESFTDLNPVLVNCLTNLSQIDETEFNQANVVLRQLSCYMDSQSRDLQSNTRAISSFIQKVDYLEEKVNELDIMHHNLTNQRYLEKEEWAKHEKDLLVAVRVSSDMCASVKKDLKNAEKQIAELNEELASLKIKPNQSVGRTVDEQCKEESTPLPLKDRQLKSNKQSTGIVINTDKVKENTVNKLDGSKRNALLKWCQIRTKDYPNIEITNFSSSWTDGLALCALLHSYIPDKIPFSTLSPNNSVHNIQVAFDAAKSIGIPSLLTINDMTHQERPDWKKIMVYIKEIFEHFEV